MYFMEHITELASMNKMELRTLLLGTIKYQNNMTKKSIITVKDVNIRNDVRQRY